MFELTLLFCSIAGGAVASISGFGIGSLITPALSLSVETKLAIAMVSIPHFIGTGIRFWMLRSHVDKKILLQFGIMSAAGGLVGALAHSRVATPALTLVFGMILIFSGFMGATALSEKLRFHGIRAWIAGGLSGLLGGLVGNQGGIRSAALLGSRISKESFVATATAVGLIVDTARMPIYFWSQWEQILNHNKLVLLTTIGVMIGTFIGRSLLKKLPEKNFRRVVSALIFLLGLFMVYQASAV